LLVKIGDEVEMEIEDFVPPLNPEGEVEKLTGMFHPANSTLTIARPTASRVNAFGLQFDNTGKNGQDSTRPAR
jgi:hypothetical protein